jgi:hypothetical protein
MIARQAGYTHGEPPPGLRPHLVLKLKVGWRFHRGAFVSPEGLHIAPPTGLPSGTEIVPMVAELARADLSTLSEAERDLARYLQVILPEGAEPAAWLEPMRSLEAVEEASLPPQISLP